MSTTALRENQSIASGLAMHRDPIDVAAAVKDYAGRIVRSARGIGAGDRQWLHDVKRDRVNLRTTIRLFELATAADLMDALYGPMAFRAALVREIQPALPVWTDAMRDEEEANHFGNLAQYAFTERRSPSTIDQLCGWMDIQAIRSTMLADAVAMAGTRSITVVSR